jgi:chorismate dehydratase
LSHLRIASVDYLNALPLVRGLAQVPMRDLARLMSGTPARCADLLRAGEVDVALIPSIEFLRIPDLAVLPEMAIASPRHARSVLLFSRLAAPEIRSVTLDRSSRTSAALLRILLSRISRHRVEYRESEPGLPRMLEKADAALLIGDAALQADAGGLKVYDLAAEWHARTGLPFVFAFWAARPGVVRPDMIAWFLESKRAGLAQRSTIAEEAAKRLGLSAQDLSRYLHENLSYDLGAEEIRSLWLFYRLAREAGLVESVREIKLLPTPEAGEQMSGGGIP